MAAAASITPFTSAQRTYNTHRPIALYPLDPQRWLYPVFGIFDDRPLSRAARSIVYDEDAGEIHMPNGTTLQSGTFHRPTLRSLLDDARDAKRTMASYALQLKIIVGEDVGESILTRDVVSLHDAQHRTIPLWQVASQFNALEMISPQVSYKDGILDYVNDATQGPRAALACAPGTLVRNLYYPDTNAVYKMGLRIKNGYLLYEKRPELVHDRWVSEDLIVPYMENTGVYGIHYNAQNRAWYKHETSNVVHQVFTSAIPMNMYGNGGDAQVQEEVARNAIYAAYVGVLALSLKLEPFNDPIVHLTLLGSGSFGVPVKVVMEEMIHALRVFARHPIQVRVHVYDRNNVREVKSHLIDFVTSVH